MATVVTADARALAARDALGALLPRREVARLRMALSGRSLAVCFGAGVDSTAMLIALRAARLRPDVITFADTGGEKPETHLHVERMARVLREWEWPSVHVCIKRTNLTTGYTTLEGNCLSNETLPSLAFGMKSCSIKWKQGPQDQYLKGAASGPNAAPAHPLWARTQRAGERIVKLIGYDCGKADRRRSAALKPSDTDFDYVYPLQVIGWDRAACVAAIVAVLGADMVPIKSACFFCPASKQWELYWLAAHHPTLLERALEIERCALTGRHSRFDAVEFGASWDELVRSADRFPSTSTTVGLGRSFAWNQWARVNQVVDAQFRVRREDRSRFLRLAKPPADAGNNASDRRAALRPHALHPSPGVGAEFVGG